MSKTMKHCHEAPVTSHNGCYISSEPLDFMPGKWTLVDSNTVCAVRATWCDGGQAVIATRSTLQLIPLEIPAWESLLTTQLTPTRTPKPQPQEPVESWLDDALDCPLFEQPREVHKSSRRPMREYEGHQQSGLRVHKRRTSTCFLMSDPTEQCSIIKEAQEVCTPKGSPMQCHRKDAATLDVHVAGGSHLHVVAGVAIGALAMLCAQRWSGIR
eukprot:TRINITY_DN3932_c0_g1_i6.p2 TRINITY_DN3932_c0_g1~~TRINITY_DN3932_c0_g1_i6.p2  ORF type:complete len:213 (-),score=18.35 TRINITY_DN3932_c0_g1_i6:116-754(-)